MKENDKFLTRMQNILKLDKEEVTRPLLNLIKSEIFLVLSRFFEIEKEDVMLNYFVGEDLKYHFEISVSTKRIRKTNYL